MLSLIPEQPSLVHHIDMVKRRSVPLVVALLVLGLLTVTCGQSGDSGVEVDVSTSEALPHSIPAAGALALVGTATTLALVLAIMRRRRHGPP